MGSISRRRSDQINGGEKGWIQRIPLPPIVCLKERLIHHRKVPIDVISVRGHQGSTKRAHNLFDSAQSTHHQIPATVRVGVTKEKGIPLVRLLISIFQRQKTSRLRDVE